MHWHILDGMRNLDEIGGMSGTTLIETVPSLCLLLTVLMIRPFSSNYAIYRDDHGHHDHESYYGDRDTESLIKVRHV